MSVTSTCVGITGGGSVTTEPISDFHRGKEVKFICV